MPKPPNAWASQTGGLREWMRRAGLPGVPGRTQSIAGPIPPTEQGPAEGGTRLPINPGLLNVT